MARPRTTAARASLRRHAPLLLVAFGAACAFPPPNEEMPLTGELSNEPEVDSSIGTDPPAPIEEGPTVAAARPVESAGAGDDEEIVDDSAEIYGPRAPVETSLVEVQDTPGEPLERVPGSNLDLQAIERDGDAELPPARETDLVPSDVSASRVDGAVSAAAASAPDVADAGDTTGDEDESDEPEPIVFEAGSIETDDGLRMAYRVGGTGQDVVLVHGWCGDAAQWDGHASELAGSYRVWALDLPGHGRSMGTGRESWTIPQFGADVAALVEAKELEDVVLVGHAMGGQVALEAAVRVPGRVRAIIGVDSLHRLAVDPNPERLDPYVERFARDYEGSMRAFIAEAIDDGTAADVRQRILDDALRCDPEVAVALMEHFGVHDPKPAARLIDCRVICINSDTAPTDVEGNRALLTSFDVAIMKGAGHWPHLEAPEPFRLQLAGELARALPVRSGSEDSVLHSLSPIVYADDVGAVRDFYVERLGFAEVDRRPVDATVAPDFVALERDGASLMVQSSATLRSDFPDVAIEPRETVLFLRVSDLEVERVRLGDDLRVAVPERTLSSGSRQLVVVDPAGSFVVLQQPRKEPTRRASAPAR
ncbi:MAG: alpha/beta fold hydrolase [Planctomycetota bacterium]